MLQIALNLYPHTISVSNLCICLRKHFRNWFINFNSHFIRIFANKFHNIYTAMQYRCFQINGLKSHQWNVYSLCAQLHMCHTGNGIKVKLCRFAHIRFYRTEQICCDMWMSYICDSRCAIKANNILNSYVCNLNFIEMPCTIFTHNNEKSYFVLL